MAKKTFINERAEYEKRYSEYMANKRKQEAQKGANAVRKTTNKFAKEYLEPATKAVASLTPAGPIIGLHDSYQSYKEGDKKGAVIGAGMEALPSVFKGIKAFGKIGKSMISQSADYANKFDYSKTKPISVYANKLGSR